MTSFRDARVIMSLGSLDPDTRPVAIQMKELHKREVAARSKYYRKVATMVENFMEHETDMVNMVDAYENIKMEFKCEISNIESAKKDLRRRRKEECHSLTHANHDDHT